MENHSTSILENFSDFSSVCEEKSGKEGIVPCEGMIRADLFSIKKTKWKRLLNTENEIIARVVSPSIRD